MRSAQRIATEPISALQAPAKAAMQITHAHETPHLPARRANLHLSEPTRACFDPLSERLNLKLKAGALKL